MARNKLSSRGINALEPGKYCDGAGLWLAKSGLQSGKWFLRLTVHGKRREMGLGGWPDVGLAEARQASSEARRKLREGNDPIRDRQRKRLEAQRNIHLFRDIARDAFEARKTELRGDGIAGRWFSPLELHVLPKIGNIPVSEITQIDIRDCLLPIWHTKTETAKKALTRASICIQHAAALGIDVDLQATKKARALLGKPRQTTTNIPSLHWKDVPIFYESLNDGSVTHLALRLLILTGVRSKSLRFMREDQIDGDIWTIPAENVKGREGKTSEFRVPLSTEVMKILGQARRHSRDGYIFPSVRKGVISDATMARLMERRGMQARPHGFRSSLRDWLAETTDAPYEVAETMLGHIVGNSVERAYRRTDYLEKRRSLLERWASHLTKESGASVRLINT
ncbi:integrase arm-type DNA-binding domain-containing protein [Sulfitobacter sp.]|uniref:tyrosine-type recombinase/integrase n=1 Tax=Sulfitobacter sp. TaxID=1903071 RepID=UPI003297425A